VALEETPEQPETLVMVVVAEAVDLVAEEEYSGPVDLAVQEREMDRLEHLEMPVHHCQAQDLVGLVAAVPGQQTTGLRGSIKYQY
jgi:hypothetical protein